MVPQVPACVSTSARETEDPRLDPRRFAVLTIPITAADWKPRNERSSPPAELNGIPIELQAAFVESFNASDFARRRRRWALLLAGGGVFFIYDVPEADRPNPGDLPRSASNGMTKHEAERAAEAANAETYRLARVPRRWTVAVRHVGAELAASDAAATAAMGGE